MQLERLIAALAPKDVVGRAQVELSDLAYDAGSVGPGALFFCVRGSRADGHDFAVDAVARGAAALVVERPLTSSSGVICVEMMRTFDAAGARFVETPVHHHPRPSGRSQFFRLPAIMRSARQLLALWWRLVVMRR